MPVKHSAKGQQTSRGSKIWPNGSEAAKCDVLQNERDMQVKGVKKGSQEDPFKFYFHTLYVARKLSQLFPSGF